MQVKDAGLLGTFYLEHKTSCTDWCSATGAWGSCSGDGRRWGGRNPKERMERTTKGAELLSGERMAMQLGRRWIQEVEEEERGRGEWEGLACQDRRTPYSTAS